MTKEEEEKNKPIINVENEGLRTTYLMVDSLVKLGASKSRITDAIEHLRNAATKRKDLLFLQKDE